MTTLTIVIPAWNEAAGIVDIANRTLAVGPGLTQAGVGELELLVVDDGSSDDTARLAAQIDGVRVVSHSTNRGYGAAIKTGFREGRGQLLAFLDADGTYPPESFPELCAALLASGADLVVGSRLAGADSQMPAVRRLGNAFFAGLVSVIGATRISDSASGMRVLRREALEQLYPLPDGLNFTPVMTTRAVHERLKMIEVPITYSERVGRSKLSVVRDGQRFLATILWTTLAYNPVRVLGWAGLGALAWSALLGLGIGVLYLQGVRTLGPFGVAALVGGSVLAVAGVSLVNLAITFSYLVNLFHDRPVRQGLFGDRPLLPGLDRHFGWLGAVGMLAGLVVAAVVLSLALSSPDWNITRVWFWLVASAMSGLIGLQLTLNWMLMRVLEALSTRSTEAAIDLGGELAPSRA